MKHILLVDDDANVLAALRRQLADRSNDFAVQAFTSPSEALAKAEEQSFDVVVADYLMPEMDGVAFLARFAELQPDTPRVILSGNADRMALADAINRIHIYRFLAKPWTEVELTVAVRQALMWHAAVEEDRRLAEECRQKGFTPPNRDFEESYQVLVVDDEPEVGNAIWRELSSANRRFQDLVGTLRHDRAGQEHFRYHIDTCVSGSEALEHARQASYDLVIADYRMPGMDGIALLRRIQDIQPDAARILISGQADLAVLAEAVNRAEIFGFIAKPWDEYDLRDLAARAISYQQLLADNRELARCLVQESSSPASSRSSG